MWGQGSSPVNISLFAVKPLLALVVSASIWSAIARIWSSRESDLVVEGVSVSRVENIGPVRPFCVPKPAGVIMSTRMSMCLTLLCELS